MDRATLTDTHQDKAPAPGLGEDKHTDFEIGAPWATSPNNTQSACIAWGVWQTWVSTRIEGLSSVALDSLETDRGDAGQRGGYEEDVW